ncbi:hypothetical protein ACSS6W_000794 [Trichoderma asperelloides]
MSWDSFKSPDAEMQEGVFNSEKMPFLNLVSYSGIGPKAISCDPARERLGFWHQVSEY